MVDLAVQKTNLYGSPMVVRGCTSNIETMAGACSFEVFLIGSDEGTTDGNYTIMFTTTDASDYG